MTMILLTIIAITRVLTTMMLTTRILAMILTSLIWINNEISNKSTEHDMSNKTKIQIVNQSRGAPTVEPRACVRAAVAGVLAV